MRAQRSSFFGGLGPVDARTDVRRTFDNRSGWDLTKALYAAPLTWIKEDTRHRKRIESCQIFRAKVGLTALHRSGYHEELAQASS